MTTKIFIFLTATSFMLAPLAPQVGGVALGDCTFEEVREWDAWAQEEGCEGNYTLEEARETCKGINAECNLNMTDAELQSCTAILYANVLRFVNNKPKKIDAVSFSVADSGQNFSSASKRAVANAQEALDSGQVRNERLAEALKAANEMLRTLPFGNEALRGEGPSAEAVNEIVHSLETHGHDAVELTKVIGAVCVELESYSQFMSTANKAPVTTMKMIPHVTSDEGGFQTEFVLTNHGSEIREFTLHAYSKNGDFLEEIHGQVAAHETVVSKPGDLFQSSKVSHVVIDEAKGIDINVKYQAGIEGCPVHLKATDVAEHTWRFFAGDWEQVWDGIVMVNQGNDPAKIQIRQINNKGVVVKSVAIESLQDLPPMAKGSVILNDLGFSPDPGSQFQISSSQNLSIVSLRGSLQNDSNFMWESHVIAD